LCSMFNYIDDIIVSCDGLCSMFNYIDDIIVSCGISGISSSPFSSESSSIRNSPDPSADSYPTDIKSNQVRLYTLLYPRTQRY